MERGRGGVAGRGMPSIDQISQILWGSIMGTMKHVIPGLLDGLPYFALMQRTSFNITRQSLKLFSVEVPFYI